MNTKNSKTRQTTANSTPPTANSTRRTRRKSSSEPIVVYIHGIGEQPPATQLKIEWDLALFGQEMGEKTRMAYWSDILHRDPGITTKSKTRPRLDDDSDLEPSILLEEAGLNPDDPRGLGFANALLATVAHSEPGTKRRGPQTKALPLPEFLRKPIARQFLRWFIKDTAAYFLDPEKRTAIKNRLIQQIPTQGEPFVLVAHSQGTIVSFEVLSLLDKRSEVSLFATMGSPLGIREVQDFIEEAGIDLIVPNKLRAWHNFADRLDPVALDAGLDLDFAANGSVRIHDHQVVNERTKEFLRFNPHSSVGYLANPTVRSIIHHAFGFDSSGRFVVARDVAEGFVGIGQRQPVLIEVLHPGYWALGESKDDMKDREKGLSDKLSSLPGRIDELGLSLKKAIRKRAKERGENQKHTEQQARVQTLRKYVAAHLTPDEISWLASAHKDLNVYAVWRSAEKRKLIDRSLSPIKVDAARASYKAEGVDITWAVLDTGVRRDHPHFQKNNTVLQVLDCTTHRDTPEPITDDKELCDHDGHGTHVAGIIAGESENQQGTLIRGIAPKARLIVYKVLDDDGCGEDAWIIKAIDDIYRKNADGTGLNIHGVNLSLGGPFDASVYGCGYSPICKELRDIWRQGVLVCVAAGNEGQVQVLTHSGKIDLNTQLSIGDPANLDDCIAVGSVNADKPHLYGVSHFSSRGPTADGRMKPDLVAPGERIKSANAAFRTQGKEYSELYRQDSGTSMACPHVSGLLAAFLSVRREFRGRPDEVKQILLDNCNDLARDPYHQGRGMPNLMKMLLNT